MHDVFFIGFIFLLATESIILAGTYKIINLFLRKKGYKNRNTKVLHIFMVILIAIFMLISLKAGLWLYENPRIKDPDYIRSTYSIVMYNTTNVTIESMEISAGDNRVLIDTICSISPREYRKVNISTQESDLINSIKPPYNVYVALPNNIDTELCVGYFGIRTGGFELVNIVLDASNRIVFEEVEHSSKEYIKALRFHRKDQDLLSWYE